MHRNGHCGTALVVYAPVIAVLVAIDLRGMALLGGAVVISGTMLPDLDTRIPFVPHRGPTHTVWFAVFVGVLVGAGGVVLGLQRGPAVAVQY
ncbi:MAG: metal-dependent hydrolase, partial [archaeon]